MPARTPFTTATVVGTWETRLDIDNLGGHAVIEGERCTGRLHPLCFHCRAHGGERAAEELR
jgi:hypothetical protein